MEIDPVQTHHAMEIGLELMHRETVIDRSLTHHVKVLHARAIAIDNKRCLGLIFKWHGWIFHPQKKWDGLAIRPPNSTPQSKKRHSARLHMP
jgi:hypothetical protein